MFYSYIYPETTESNLNKTRWVFPEISMYIDPRFLVMLIVQKSLKPIYLIYIDIFYLISGNDREELLPFTIKLLYISKELLHVGSMHFCILFSVVMAYSSRNRTIESQFESLLLLCSVRFIIHRTNSRLNFHGLQPKIYEKGLKQNLCLY